MLSKIASQSLDGEGVPLAASLVATAAAPRPATGATKKTEKSPAKSRTKPPAKSAAKGSTTRSVAAVEVTVKTMSAAKLASTLYFYQAIVRAVYDGDTMTVDIDLGMHNWVHGEKLRLLRINAPELRGTTHKKGEEARDFLRSMVDGKEVVIETYKDDKEKYGRYLAEIWVADEQGRYYNVNDRMVKEGHAVYKDYS